MILRCKACGQEMTAPVSLTETKVACPNCQALVIIPSRHQVTQLRLRRLRNESCYAGLRVFIGIALTLIGLSALVAAFIGWSTHDGSTESIESDFYLVTGTITTLAILLALWWSSNLVIDIADSILDRHSDED